MTGGGELRPLRYHALVALVGVAVACNGAVRTGDPRCEALYDAYSAFMEKCDPDYANSYGFREYFGTRERFAKYCSSELAAPGITGAFGDALDACTRELRGGTCTLDLVFGEACKMPAVGNAADGAACGLDAQCQSGYCVGARHGAPWDRVLMTEFSCGTCASKLPLGQPCSAPSSTDAAPCIEGAWCHWGTNLCASLGAAGAACNHADECQSPLVCVGVVAGDDGRCTIGTDIGSGCKTNASPTESSCKSGLRCDAMSNTCQSPYFALGQRCDDTMALCDRGLYCDPKSNTCRAREHSGLGQPCNDSTTLCVDGLGCEPTSGRCEGITFADPGQPCNGANALCTRLTCSTSGMCPTIIADGERCDPSRSDQECDALSRCTNGTCQMWSPAACN